MTSFNPSPSLSRWQRLRNSGIQALRANRRDRARALLVAAATLQPNDVTTWYCLSGAVATPQEQRFCLERVLELQPEHQQALRGLERVSHVAANSPMDRIGALDPAVRKTGRRPKELRPAPSAQPPKPASTPAYELEVPIMPPPAWAKPQSERPHQMPTYQLEVPVMPPPVWKRPGSVVEPAAVDHDLAEASPFAALQARLHGTELSVETPPVQKKSKVMLRVLIGLLLLLIVVLGAMAVF